MPSSLPHAFLSHSSQDKQFVSAVANRLGRHRVVYDAMHFENGDTLISEIEKHVKASDIFVFFASPNSIKSFWCMFEVDAARAAIIQRVMRRSLTYIISNTVSVHDLPAWLRESKVIVQPCVGQVVRDIDHHLMALLSADDRPPFVGRNALKDDFLQGLVDPLRQQLFAISGLEAVGRRSYARNVLEENLALRPGPTIHFDTLVGPEELYIQLLTDADSCSAISLKGELSAFSALAPEAQIDEIVGKLNVATAPNEYPVFVDHGGLTDKQGNLYGPFNTLIEHFLKLHDPARHLVLICRGRPKLSGLAFADTSLHQFVPPLTLPEAAGLLRRLLSSAHGAIDETKLQDCANLCEGYPPSVIFAARFIQKYGVDILLSSPDYVAALQRRVFVKFLRDLALDPAHIRVLRYLAREGSLDFNVIAAALGWQVQDLATALLRLVDLSAVTYDSMRYAISWPIRDSVIRVWGELTDKDYADIAANLGKWTSKTSDLPDVDTIDALLSAQVKGNVQLDWNDLSVPVLPSSMVRLCENCYHQRDYSKAYALSLRAEQFAKTRAQRHKALAVRIKSLAQLQRWNEAEVALSVLDKELARERFDIRGFVLRKRRRYSEALAEYDKAIATGHNPNSVLRDSADCLFRLGRFADAIERIKVVRQRDPDNPWVLDLLARCYTDAKDDDGFASAIADLKNSDRDGRFWKHRDAVFFAKRGNLDAAMRLAEEACTAPGAPFETYTLRADIAIEQNDFTKAAGLLEQISSKFRHVNDDVQSGLSCKFYLAQGKWQEAESFWAKIVDRGRPVHRAIRLRILDVKSKDSHLALTQREAARGEIEQLRAEGIVTDTILAEDVVLQNGD